MRGDEQVALAGCAGTRFDCGGVVVPPVAPLVTSWMNWSAALSAAAAGKYTLMVTHAAISRLASAIFNGNTRRMNSSLFQARA